MENGAPHPLNLVERSCCDQAYLIQNVSCYSCLLRKHLEIEVRSVFNHRPVLMAQARILYSFGLLLSTIRLNVATAVKSLAFVAATWPAVITLQ